MYAWSSGGDERRFVDSAEAARWTQDMGETRVRADRAGAVLGPPDAIAGEADGHRVAVPVRLVRQAVDAGGAEAVAVVDVGRDLVGDQRAGLGRKPSRREDAHA